MKAWPAPFLLYVGAAWAGAPVDASGSHVSPSFAGNLRAGGEVFMIIIIACAIFSAIVLALNWGVQKVWKAAFKTQPPFDFFSVAALVGSLLLGAFGVFVVPQFSVLFASFGANLPAPTLLLMAYSNLLPAVFLLLLCVLYALKENVWRERYFAAVLAGEFAFLVLAVYTMYLPIFRMAEAI